MTNEEAKKILDVIRSYYAGQASVTKNEYPKETIAGYSLVDVSNACLQGSKALEQEPCEDAISRQAVLEKAISVPIAKVVTEDEVIYRKVVFVDDIENLPPVTPQKMGHCKDCKYFESARVAKVDGIPLIVAHEICSRWGDGCKTKEDGYCFLFDPQERSDKE